MSMIEPSAPAETAKPPQDEAKLALATTKKKSRTPKLLVELNVRAACVARKELEAVRELRAIVDRNCATMRMACEGNDEEGKTKAKAEAEKLQQVLGLLASLLVRQVYRGDCIRGLELERIPRAYESIRRALRAGQSGGKAAVNNELEQKDWEVLFVLCASFLPDYQVLVPVAKENEEGEPHG